MTCVGRTLLSDAFDFGFDLTGFNPEHRGRKVRLLGIAQAGSDKSVRPTRVVLTPKSSPPPTSPG